MVKNTLDGNNSKALDMIRDCLLRYKEIFSTNLTYNYRFPTPPEDHNEFENVIRELNSLNWWKLCYEFKEVPNPLFIVKMAEELGVKMPPDIIPERLRNLLREVETEPEEPSISKLAYESLRENGYPSGEIQAVI